MSIEAFFIGVVIAAVGGLIAHVKGNESIVGAAVSGLLFVVGGGPLGWLIFAVLPRIERIAREPSAERSERQMR